MYSNKVISALILPIEVGDRCSSPGWVNLNYGLLGYATPLAMSD